VFFAVAGLPMLEYPVDYDEILSSAGGVGYEALVGVLSRELPVACCDAYARTTTRQTEICRFRSGTFDYVFDDLATLEAKGLVATDLAQEARLVVAVGRSNPQPRRRDDHRLRGWVGRTEATFGKRWDKGHYIAHSIGGAVDGIEANVFVQRRDLNRGWSIPGKRFRMMEDACFRHPGVFCFSRPIYGDGTSRPVLIEFGLLKFECTLWVERFDNRG
jgi:hypothetical protein